MKRKKFNIISTSFKQDVTEDVSSIYVRLSNPFSKIFNTIYEYIVEGLWDIFKASGCDDSYLFFVKHKKLHKDWFSVKLNLNRLKCDNELKMWICQKIVYLLNSMITYNKDSVSVSALLCFGNEEYKFTYAIDDSEYKLIKNAWVRSYTDYVLSNYNEDKKAILLSRLRSFVVKRVKSYTLRYMLGNMSHNRYEIKVNSLNWAYRMYRYIESGIYGEEDVYDVVNKLTPEIEVLCEELKRKGEIK